MARLAGWSTFAAVLAGLLTPQGESTAHAQFGFSSQFELSSAVQLNEPDNQTSKHLERVKAFLDDRQWDDAVETLRQLMESDGERVLPLAEGRYVTIRDYCHAKIAELPPEALKLYRDRVDALAKRWYDEGVAGHDAAPLARVVNQLFASSWGDDALLALGEMALERGQYGAAREHWERISPLLRTADGRPLWLALQGVDLAKRWAEVEPLLLDGDGPLAWVPYIDSDLSLADIRARLVLTSILEGNQPRARSELEIFRQLHPTATGELGGRKVTYAAALAELLTNSSRWPAPAPSENWPTFAGSPTRNRQLPPAFRLAGPAWGSHVSLGEPLLADTALARSFGFGGRPVAEDLDGLLSYHPLVVGDLILVNDQSRILAFNLHTGEPAWKKEGGEIYNDKNEREPGRTAARSGLGRLGVPRFTMSASGGKLFVRMGDPVTSWPPESPREGKPGYIACLDLDQQGLLLRQIEPDGAEWAFEGSPISEGGRLYVAMRRSDVRPQAYVACFDGQTGKRLWRTRVCAAETPARGQVDEVTHNLLAIAEDTIYYNTNLGAVAAMSVRDGQIRWVSLYPRATRGDLSRRAAHLYRDLNPCVYAQGMLLVAPLDSQQILGLDAATGSILWASSLPDDVVHLLGVRGDHLIASGDRLWWLNVLTGKVVRRWPESKSAGPRGYGRGAIAGHEIHWPSHDRIWIFDCRTAEQTQEPISLTKHGATGGNLLMVNGYLLIASADKLYGFSQFPRRREALERDVTAHPTKAAPHFRLAQCEEAMKNTIAAVALYRRTLELAERDEQYEGETLSDLARQRMFALLRSGAASAATAGSWDEAIGLWRQAVELAVDDTDRLAAGLHLGDTLLASGEPAEATRQFQLLLASPKLNRLQVTLAPDRTLQARLALAARIDQLIAAHGRGPYSEFDAVASTALAAAEKRGDAAEIARLTALYPNSLAARTALARRTTARPQPAATAAAPLQVPPQLLREIPDSQPLAVLGGSARTSAAVLLAGELGARCVALRDGVEQWNVALAAMPTWAGNVGNTVLIGTADELVALARDNGAVRWRWNAGAQEKFATPTVQFEVCGEQIIVKRGGASLVAIEADTGKVIWTFSPRGRVVGPLLFAAGEYLALQHGEAAAPTSEPADLVSLRTIVLRVRDGTVLHEWASADGRWSRLPVALDESRIVTVTVSNRIELFDLATGELLWSRSPVDPSPGLPTEVAVRGDAIMMCAGDGMARRLSALDGSDAWSEPVQLGEASLARGEQLAAIDEQALYTVDEGVLRAVQLSDGRQLWRCPLAAADGDLRRAWRVSRLGPFVLAFPREFSDGEHIALSFVQATDGKIVHRLPPFQSTPGESRLAIADALAVVQASNHLWVLSLDGKQSDRIRVSNK